MSRRRSGLLVPALSVGAVAGLAGGAAYAAGLRLARASARPSERWRTMRIEPRGGTRLGLSFRPLQAAAFGLEPGEALRELLARPFEIVRLAAYWDRLEPAPGRFDAGMLDWQLDAVERAGKQAIVAVGAVKSFGYPEFFVPGHRLPAQLPEGRLVTLESHPELLEAACEFVERVVERYRGRTGIVAWQVEHEAVDPLGVEHSWRLAEAFVRREVEVVRRADPSRPILMNGYLAATLPVAVQQAWRTRGQGDSLAVALRLADIVGIDWYPRHALVAAGPLSLYLDGTSGRAARRRRDGVLAEASAAGLDVIVAEGQAEPWEASTTPPSIPGRVACSCPPERLIASYNGAMGWSRPDGPRLGAYLFWGAEYWLRRRLDGDDAYLAAVDRVLSEG